MEKETILLEKNKNLHFKPTFYVKNMYCGRHLEFLKNALRNFYEYLNLDWRHQNKRFCQVLTSVYFLAPFYTKFPEYIPNV